MNLKDFAECPKRVNPDTFIPEILLLDEWVNLEMLQDLWAIFGTKGMIHEVREVYKAEGLNYKIADELERILKV